MDGGDGGGEGLDGQLFFAEIKLELRKLYNVIYTHGGLLIGEVFHIRINKRQLRRTHLDVGNEKISIRHSYVKNISLSRSSQFLNI